MKSNVRYILVIVTDSGSIEVEIPPEGESQNEFTDILKEDYGIPPSKMSKEEISENIDEILKNRNVTINGRSVENVLIRGQNDDEPTDVTEISTR